MTDRPSDNLTIHREKELNSLSERVEKLPDSPEKAELQQEVKRLLAEVRAGNAQEQDKKAVEKDRFRTYNDRRMSEFSVRISSVGTSLDVKTDENNMKLKELLKNAEQDHSYENISALQKFMREKWTDSVVSKKGDPDGFFGPLTMGSLEKIVEIKKVENNPVSTAQKEGGTESKSTTPATTSGGTPENSSPSAPTNRPDNAPTPNVPVKNLETKKEILLSKLDEWTAYFGKVVEEKQQHFRNKTELEKDFIAIGRARDGILKYINQLTTKKDLAPEELEKINSAKILIARYFADELPNISNSHFKDYTLASTQLLDVIGVFEYTNKEKQISRRILPQPPTRADIEKKLADTPEGALIKQHLRNGKTMDQILMNPKFKSAWFNVTEKIYGEWEDKLGKQLKWTLDGYNAGNILLNPQQLEALNLLNNIHGVEVLDIASRNKDRAKMFGTGLLAVGVGAAGAALTATGVGAVGGAPMLALASSAIVGGMITTGASMAIDGRAYSGKEWLIEGGINTATFAVGGMLFKLGAKATMAGRVAKVGLYTAEVGGVVATGVVSDEIRGCFYGADVSLTESIKQNLVWALLPLAFRMMKKPGFTESQTRRAEGIESNLKRAETQTNMGDKAGTKATIERVVADAENLADDVKRTAENGKSQGKGKTGEQSKTLSESDSVKKPKPNKDSEGGAKGVEGIKNITPLPKNLSEAKAQINEVNDKLSALRIPFWDFLSLETQTKLQKQYPKRVKWFKHAIIGDVIGEMRKGLDIVRSTEGISSNIIKGTFDITRTALWSQKSGSWKPGVFTWGVTGLTALEMYSDPDPKKSVLGDFATKQFNNMYQWAYFGWITNILIESMDAKDVLSDIGTKPLVYLKDRVTGETPQAPSVIAPFFK